MSLHLVQAQSSHKRALSLVCTVEHCESQLSRIVNKSAISKSNHAPWTDRLTNQPTNRLTD